MPYGYGSANTGKSSSSSGGGGYRNIHQTGAITQTPGRRTWSPGVGGTQHIPKTKKTVTTGGASPFGYTRTPKGRTTTGGIEGQWANFLKHRLNTQLMKGKIGTKHSYVPTYTHALGGYDWKQNFPDSAEWADKALAYGYQHVTEIPRGIMNIDPMSSIYSDTGIIGSLSNAFNKANVEAAKNIQGFTGETIPAETLEKYHDWQNLASGGLIDLYRYGGFI